MLLKNKNELMLQIESLYEFSYLHYSLGKSTNMRGKFPDICCWPSAKNLHLSLMDQGYPNAVSFGNNIYDHHYTGVPFKLNDSDEYGFIIIDPTYDQLWDDPNNNLRNNLLISKGCEWEYKTDWEDGADLYPNEISNLNILRRDLTNNLGKCSFAPKNRKKIKWYFKKIFKTPLILNNTVFIDK